MKADGAKKSAKPPVLSSLLPPDKALEMSIKLSYHVAFMWENCVIGNPPQLNPCEYGWERNEGEKSLRPTMLQNGIKIAPDEILQTTYCKCVSTQCNKNKCSCVRAGLNCSEFCDCQQCDYQSIMQMVDNEIEDENNDCESGTGDEWFIRYDIIICCINLV